MFTFYGWRRRSLAKHKLVYAVLALALAPHVPIDMPIVPVYLSVVKDNAGLAFRIAECKFPDPRVGVHALDELSTERCMQLTLPLHGRILE